MITFRILSKPEDSASHIAHIVIYFSKSVGLAVVPRVSISGQLTRIVVENIDVTSEVAGTLTSELLALGCSSVHVINGEE